VLPCTCTEAESVEVAEDPTCTRPGSHDLVPIGTNRVVSEAPLSALRSWLTPTPLFYARNHFDVPRIEANEWTLTIGGAVSNPVEISYSELVRLPKRPCPR
jgi:DMSO/TMAO reductase YedYZ molybdopterin-dependent catalytic subunit